MTNPALTSPVLHQSAPAAPTVVVHVPPPAPVVPLKSLGIAYVLLLIVGLLGIHHFYLGKSGRGLLYLLTAGGCFVGVILDLFTLPAQVRQVNAQRVVGVR